MYCFTKYFVLFICIQAYSQFGGEQIISTSAIGPQRAIAVYVDNDSALDVLVASQFDSSISWFKNLDGNGNFGPKTVIASINQPNWVHGADLDGDLDIDILTQSGPDDSIYWIENLDGNGSFGSPNIISNTADGAYSVIAADLDDDTDLDVVSAADISNEITWYENLDGAGNFAAGIPITTLSNGRSVLALDLDADLDNDIVVSSSGSVTLAWFENLDGLGSFGPQQIINGAGLAIESIYGADVDSDDDFDLIVAIPGENRISWFENIDGNGSFGIENIISNNASSAFSVFAADLDLDMDIDILSASPSDNKIAWYENIDGMGAFSTEQIISTNAVGAISVFAADLNNDTDIDVLSASQNDNKVAWYSNLILGFQDLSKEEFLIYPNPTQGYLYIDYSSKYEYLSISVHDASGRKVINQLLDEDFIDLNALTSGIYHISILTNDKVYSTKIIKL